MSEPRVRVIERIEVIEPGSTITVDPGIFASEFLFQMLGQAAYMQAYRDRRLVLIHEGTNGNAEATLAD